MIKIQNDPQEPDKTGSPYTKILKRQNHQVAVIQSLSRFWSEDRSRLIMYKVQYVSGWCHRNEGRWDNSPFMGRDHGAYR